MRRNDWEMRRARHQGHAKGLLGVARNRLRFYRSDSLEHAKAILLLARAQLHLDIGPMWPKPDKLILNDIAWALDRYRAAKEVTDAPL